MLEREYIEENKMKLRRGAYTIYKMCIRDRGTVGKVYQPMHSGVHAEGKQDDGNACCH